MDALNEYFTPCLAMMIIDYTVEPEQFIILSPDCWIEVWPLPDYLCVSSEFDTLWNIHPKEKGKVKIYGREIETPRWQQSYGRDYRFSGMMHRAEPIPDNHILKNFMNWISGIDRIDYDQLLLNWYIDGSHYIGPHSDDESQLIKNPSIWSVTYYDKPELVDQYRKFVVKIKEKYSDMGWVNKIEIPLEHNKALVMRGMTQQYYKHEVPKKLKSRLKRINLTARKFKSI